MSNDMPGSLGCWLSLGRWATLRAARRLAVWLFLAAPLLVPLRIAPRDAVAQLRGPITIDVLEEQTDPFVPLRPRTEADEDRLLASALYAHGRMLVQREQYAEALSRYQRAFRYAPSPAIVPEIIAIASELDRPAEAVRYAILGAELEVEDGELALRLAGFPAEEGNHARAIRLLQNAIEARKPPTGLNRVLLQGELLRLYLVSEQVALAAQAADGLRELLAQPALEKLATADEKKWKEQRDRLELLIAESYLRAGRPADAEAMFRKAQQLRPSPAILQFQLARVAAEQRDWKLARERLDQYFREKSTAAGLEPYELLARAIAEGKADDPDSRAPLLAALQALRTADPTNVPLGYFAAEKMVEAGELDAAAKLYEQLLSRQPTTTAYRQLAAIYRRQRNVTGLGRLIGRATNQAGMRELLEAEAAAIVADPALLDELVRFVQDRQSPLAGVPRDSALMGVGLLALGGQKLEIAQELYSQAVATPGADIARIRETIALAALVSDQHAWGAEILEQAIAAKPPAEKLALYYYYLAGARAFSGETDQALAAAEKGANLKPDSVEFQSRGAWVCFHAKRWDEAEKRYRDLLGRFDSQHEAEAREVLRQAKLVLSNIAMVRGQLPEAEEWLEQVLDEFPEHPGALNDLGYLWTDQGKRLERALRMIELAVAQEPDNAAYRDSLGWAYYQLGRYGDAVRELERAVAAAPEGVIYDHLGDAYLKLANQAKAVEAWRKGAALLESAEEATERDLITAKIHQYSEMNP